MVRIIRTLVEDHADFDESGHQEPGVAVCDVGDQAAHQFAAGGGDDIAIILDAGTGLTVLTLDGIRMK